MGKTVSYAAGNPDTKMPIFGRRNFGWTSSKIVPYLLCGTGTISIVGDSQRHVLSGLSSFSIFKSSTRASSSTKQTHTHIHTPKHAHSRRQLHANYAADVNDAIVPCTQSNYFFMFCHNTQNCNYVGYRTPIIMVNHEQVDYCLNQRAER